MRGSTVNKSSQGGYLLLEVVLAMGLAAALLGGIFAIATGSMSLAERIVEEGRYQTRREAFLNFMGRNFEQLPGNAVIELVTQETAQRYLPTMTIQNAPASFSFAGLPISAQAIVLNTVPVPSGGVNVVLEYYEEPLLDDEDQVATERQEPAGSLILYRDIWRFEMRVMDSRTMEWVSDWDIRGRLPLQIELNAVFEPNGEEVIHYFWVPPKANPSALMRGMGQGSNARGGTRGGGNQGGNDDGDPQGGGGGQ
ncbi:hypothetical protein [Roseibacillus ishigakijimensis]|uniref:Prepilin-type N-terminal cleavage/methylation domain-containing protein n=1 Tax=Roseibacillus ishigakijimensis TaxID=454146 RepID=A0A934RRX0_9BACT|nr:hypothetical protein [Roseibacillus ishigakijimensis]MBK1833904.1 hypothetical protein [Roseibacillus ishigakijimensis]